MNDSTNTLRPDAIVATWINAESTRGFQLQADGHLVENHREGVSHQWSPPEVVGELRRSSTAEHILGALGLGVPQEVAERDHAANVAKLEQLIADAQRLKEARQSETGTASTEAAIEWLGYEHGLKRALAVLNGEG